MNLSKDAAINDLVRRKSYGKAIELIQAELTGREKNERLRLQLANVHALAGSAKQAVAVLAELADDLAQDGFAAKAIAVLKKIQKIEPGRSDVEDKLSQLARVKVQPMVEAWTPASPPPELALEIGFEPSLLSDEGRRAAAVAPEPPLVATPLFSGFSKEEALAVIRGLRLLTFQAGAIIVTEGEPGGSLFIIATGLCRAHVKNASGRSMEVRTLQEGDFFGEISLLTGAARTATVTAATRCELLELEAATLDSIAATHPQVRDVLDKFYQQRANSTVEVSIRAMKSGP